MRYLRLYLSSLLALILIVACETTYGAQSTQSVTAEVIPTVTPAPVIQAATPTIIPTPLDPTRLVIWWPEPLSPADNNEAANLLEQQINAFQSTQGNVDVQLRLKTAGGVGGIMSTLRAASPVAPGALPDLTLMQRSDLQAAIQAGLIYPLEGSVTSAILGDLNTSALALGQVDGQLYGLPYMLEVQHMAYRTDIVAAYTPRFDAVLASGLSFALPAAQTARINGVLLTQYLDAGGTLPENGFTEIDSDALLTTLEFYEEAVNRGLISSAVLNYASPDDYINGLINGNLDAAVMTSTDYLNLIESDEGFGFGPVPTVSGATVGEMDGWMWVMTTSSADRQALAARFLNWMLNATRQGEYSRTINMIPSQQTAMQTWENNTYTEFVRQMLNNALLPLSDSEGGTIGRSLQNALVAVVSQESTALEATEDLQSGLSSG